MLDCGGPATHSFAGRIHFSLSAGKIFILRYESVLSTKLAHAKTKKRERKGFAKDEKMGPLYRYMSQFKREREGGRECSQPYGDLTHFTGIAKYRSDSTPK